MCTAGDLGKVRIGNEQDKAREERVILFHASKTTRSKQARIISLVFASVFVFPSLGSVDCYLYWSMHIE